MGTYKVLQDIEAEDKLLGPLTLKQFIFAIIFLGIGFIEFKLITLHGLSLVRWPIVIALLFPFTIFGFLAAPISRDQPNDIWLLARIRFLIKPHKRIWNQDGISQLVTVTVPKKIEHFFTNGLNANEVQSRLTALANTLDSRGWATKNVDVNLFAQPGYLSISDGSDRLVAPSSLPIDQQMADIRAADDMMDEHSNPTAQHLEQMVQQSTAAHKQQVIQNFQHPQPDPQTPANYWFLNQPAAPPPTLPVGMSTFQNSTVIAPGTPVTTSVTLSADEQALLQHIESDKALESAYYGNLKTIQPLGAKSGESKVESEAAITAAQSPKSTAANTGLKPTNYTPPDMLPSIAPMTPPENAMPPTTSSTSINPAVSLQNDPEDYDVLRKSSILRLANNDDLNVATIARQARQISEADDEVVISLH